MRLSSAPTTYASTRKSRFGDTARISAFVGVLLLSAASATYRQRTVAAGSTNLELVDPA